MKVIIEVNGGLVQTVWADQDIDLTVLDWDEIRDPDNMSGYTLKEAEAIHENAKLNMRVVY